MKSYAGIGSRETPESVMKAMTKIASTLQDLYTMRSGGADGADMAFEKGISNGNMEIYLPWRGFNGNKSPLYGNPKTEAMAIAAEFHKKWDSLSDAAKKLMTRNVHQILGKDLTDPVAFVLCWTRDGCEEHQHRTRNTGGTGQAISIASELGVNVINMKNMFWKDRLEQQLEIDGVI